MRLGDCIEKEMLEKAEYLYKVHELTSKQNHIDERHSELLEENSKFVMTNC